jgi:predicted HicB family RNase H-like nuclease
MKRLTAIKKEMIVNAKRIKKRDRSMSKIIDFESDKQRKRAQTMADDIGISLKEWIEELIAMKTGIYK